MIFYYYKILSVICSNVAVELVEAGLAQAQEHRGGDLRSKDYELILLAEDRAKKLKKGLHAPEDKAPVFYVNDITQLDHDKARQYLPYLKRAGRQRYIYIINRNFIEFS